MTQTSRRSLSCPPLPRTIDSRCPWLALARTAPAQHQATTCNPARQQVLPTLCPPVPRCHRLGISPQPAPLGLRLALPCRRTAGDDLVAVPWRSVSRTKPGPARTCSRPASATPTGTRRTSRRYRSILLALGHGFTVSQQLGQVLLGCSPERLPQLGGADPVKPDLVLTVFNVQQRDGVAPVPSCHGLPVRNSACRAPALPGDQSPCGGYSVGENATAGGVERARRLSRRPVIGRSKYLYKRNAPATVNSQYRE